LISFAGTPKGSAVREATVNSASAMPNNTEDQSAEGGVLNGRTMNASDGGASDNSGQDTRAPFGGVENDDVALAKILQEQERAFLALARSNISMENIPPSSARQSAQALEEGNESLEQEEKPLTDEEIAWKLMQEEEDEFQKRMLAMAGVSSEFDDGPQYSSEDIMDPDDFTYEELTALGDAVGTVSAGLEKEKLSALPIRTFREICKRDGVHDPCIICQIEFEQDDAVQELPCHHIYHPECISQWLAHKKTCPHCGQEI
jgi:E3 ubiquitin-protein ligase BIG BROTHER-like protein